MAILDGGINGGFSGKVGNVVGYDRFGKSVIRAIPKYSAKIKNGSDKQKTSRSKFTTMQSFLSPALYFIRVGFELYAHSKQMTAHNAAKSYNMLHAFTPEDEIDYSKVLLSFGDLPGALDATVQKDDVGLHFNWADNSKEIGANSKDQVMLLAYDVTSVDQNNHPDPDAYYMLSGARRKARTETLEIHPALKGHTMHTYIAFVSDDRKHISMSTYVGEIVF